MIFFFFSLGLVVQIVLHDPEHKKIYATGGRSKVPIYVTGVVKVDHAEITILDSDLGNVETKKKYFDIFLPLSCSAFCFSHHLRAAFLKNVLFVGIKFFTSPVVTRVSMMKSYLF